MADDHVFAGPGQVFVRETAEPKGKKLQQLVWGDWVRVLSRERESQGWLRVKGRGTEGWLAVADAQAERLLEVNFVDVGQGDGAFVVTPDDEFALIDAGQSDHMRRFLSWRFNLKLDHPGRSGEPHEVGRTLRFAFAAISHADADHYQGFGALFDSPAFKFDRVYHNTLVERPAASASQSLGPRAKIGSRNCVVELVETPEQLAALFARHPDAKTKYLPLLRTAANSGRVGTIRGLTADVGHLEKFGPDHRTGSDKPFSIEVLGPIPIAAGQQRGLPFFSDTGPTKNGHSLILRLNYGAVRVLLGGDLNTAAEKHLLTQRLGGLPPSADDAQRQSYFDAAHNAFGADIAKACHHGSADFSVDFLRVIHAAATVVSSGDNESHCHPRPDTLGAIGRHSRGERPLIFSTELMRSTREFSQPLSQVKDDIRTLQDELLGADATRRKEIKRRIDALLDRVERNVAVYGLISLRTDGKRAVVAQKLERTRSQTGEDFDLQWLSPDANGELMPDVAD